MIVKPAYTVWLLALTSLLRATATTLPKTSCTSYVTSTSSCTSIRTITSIVTAHTTPTTTSTVFDTITATAPTQTTIATETSTETDTETTTRTLYSTVWTTSTSTFTVVSYWQHTINTNNARGLGEHAETALEVRAPKTHTTSTPSGVVCTDFNTETVTTTVTPQASSTTITTVTTSETSTIYVSATTTVTTTVEASEWATRTAKPTFYIAASNAPNVPDGTRLGFYSSSNEYATFSSQSTPSLFEYDPANGLLYDTTGRQGFNDDGSCLGYKQACVYFNSPSVPVAIPSIPLSASINPNNNVLSLTASGGYSVPELAGNGDLLIGNEQIATTYPVTLVAQIVDQH